MANKLEVARRSAARNAIRNYRKEYDEYHGTREQKDNRNDRNKARRKVGLSTGDPREVDHKTSLDKGGSNQRGNLRAVSRTANRKKYTGKS
jgi:5-methylcytosine-specific restriction endonuclease McrA